MTKSKTTKAPGAWAHIACILLALLMTLTTALTCLMAGVCSVAGDREVLLRASDTVLDEQVARVEQVVRAQAAAYGFSAEPVLMLTGRDAIADYNAQVADWWAALLRDPTSTEVPAWTSAALTDVIMNDAGYQAQVAPTVQRTTAVNTIVPTIAGEVSRSALPLRASLLEAGLKIAQQRFGLRSVVAGIRLLPAALGLVTLILTLLMLLCCARRMRRGLVFAGAALGAGGLVAGGVLLLINAADIAGRAAQISAILPKQLGVLAGEIGLRCGLAAAGCFVLGFVLIGVHQRRAAK